MSNKAAVAVAFLAMILAAGPSGAADEEGCLMCHRHDLRRARGSGRIEELRVSDHGKGSHGTLYCTDCHVEARSVPHEAAPGPSSCIGQCHGTRAGAAAAHRRASFGGLTESHRSLSTPYAPCLLCHGWGPGAEGRAAYGTRCSGCHPDEGDAVASGVHGRIAGRQGAGMCPGCHRAHPESQAAGAGIAAECGGKECHAEAGRGMRRLAGHGAREKGKGTPGKAGRAGLFVAIVAAGLLSGRALGGGRGGRKG
jgi:hypothetical protein